MKLKHHINKKSIITAAVTLAIIIAILSLTIGKDILAGKQPGLQSFAIIHFAGYLFFLLMPVEALVPYYVSQGHSSFSLVVIAVVTAMLAQIIDYGIGFLFSEKVVDGLISEKRYKKAQKTIEKYGSIAILLFNLLPLSSPILVAAAGMVKLRLRIVLLYSLIGLVIKYAAIIYFFGFLG